MRLRRSFLYMPGSNDRALAKLPALPADGFILDLEDAVAAGAKAGARAKVAAALDLPLKTERVVRVNRFDEGDVQAAAGADAVLVPKVEGRDEIEFVADRFDGPIWCMIETPLGVIRAEALAEHSRVAGFVVGSNDLAKDLRARPGRDRAELLPALGRILLAARAFGRVCLDGVYIHLDDEAGLDAECRQGRALGFDGKTLIHPKQLATANRAFAPDPAEVEAARRIVAGFEAARAEGKAVVAVDGRLVEALHAEEARRLIQMAEAIGSAD